MGKDDKPRKSTDSNEPYDLSRRQFLKFTSATIVAGVARGIGGMPRISSGDGFPD